MELGGSMPHSQGLSNNLPIPSQINPFPRIVTYFLNIILILSSHLHLGFPKGLFLVGFPVNILKDLLSYSFLTTRPVHLNLVDLITLAILGERNKL